MISPRQFLHPSIIIFINERSPVYLLSFLGFLDAFLGKSNPSFSLNNTTTTTPRTSSLSLSLLCCGFFFNIILFFLAKESWFWLELLGSNYLYNKFMQIYFKKFLYIIKPSLSSLQLVSQLNYAPKLNFKANLKK